MVIDFDEQLIEYFEAAISADELKDELERLGDRVYITGGADQFTERRLLAVNERLCTLLASMEFVRERLLSKKVGAAGRFLS